MRVLAFALICALIRSRTSGAAVVADTVRSFFRAFPSPSAVLDAAEADIQALIFPLGLQPIRCRSVCDISRAFLGTNWTEPSEFYGVGKFTTDSWRIFCRGDTRGAGVEDVNLRRYLSWLKTSGSGSSGGGGGDADGASGSQDGGRQRPSSSARKLRTAAADVATTKGQRSKTAAAKRQKQAAMLTAGALRRLTRSATATAASDAGAASRKRKAAAAPALPAAKSLSSKAKIQRRR